MWEKDADSGMLPHALEQELIFVPCVLNQTSQNLLGNHWGLTLFTKVQVRLHGQELY